MGARTDLIPPDLLPAVTQECGPIEHVEDRSWDHGEAQVLHVSGRSGTCFVKRHRTVDHHRREVRAYEHWVAGWADVPRFLGSTPDPLAIAVSELPGISPLSAAMPELAEVHRQAGAFSARLHDLPVHDDDIALRDAVAQRTDAWLVRAVGMVEPATIDRVRAAIDEVLPLLDGWRRRACHRDFTERNWLWDGERLAVFDFGLSRLDLALTDVERLWSSSWREHPELADAYWDGYGATPTSDEEAVLVAYGVLQALTTVVWSVDHADQAYEENGRERLRWLLGSA
ncbi:MAG: aminoglycoside phosphotransferase family protein [Actinomycetota bacterium]